VRAFLPHPHRESAAAAFTLTELLLVIGILALLVALRLPALCRTKAPVRLAQCRSNCQQIGAATLLYRGENNDCFPYGNRVMGPGTGAGSVVDPTGWPMQLLRYLDGNTNVQPKVYVCPSESNIAGGWPFQLHYQGNRMLVSDIDATDQPIRGAQVRNLAIYWLFMEKGPADFINIKPGGLANPILAAWNYPPGYPTYRRHGGGVHAAAADGHVDWLRMPPYQPGRPPPTSFIELGDCANGQNPASTWYNNSPDIKLYCRYSTTGF
jgi:prepilin-type processing-associated H-X9-DG protein